VCVAGINERRGVGRCHPTHTMNFTKPPRQRRLRNANLLGSGHGRGTSDDRKALHDF
jgi:hypothetical protein